MIRVIVVDDEVHARSKMRSLLSVHEDVAVVAECDSGASAVDAIREHTPDLVFLDIQMPGMSGLDVVRSVGVSDMPMVVFATAYDRFAIEAFEAHAVDYLLKPIDPARLTRTLDYVRERRAVSGDDARRRLEELLARIGSSPRYVRRFAIKSGGTIHVVDAEDIDWISADGNYVTFHAGGKSHLHRETLSRVEAQLDPERFARVHRSHIVNLDRVRRLKSDRHGDYTVVMEDGHELTLTRTYRDRFLARFGSRE